MKINQYFFYLLVICVIYVCFFNTKETFEDVDDFDYDYNITSHKQLYDKRLNKGIYKYNTTRRYD